MTGFVNTGLNRGNAGGGPGEKNCAICAAAGAVNLILYRTLAQPLTTGGVAQQMYTADGEHGFGRNVDIQAKKIREFVCAKTARRFDQIGKMNGEAPYPVALDWMLRWPPYTVFAVCALGFVDGTLRCHWLNAFKAGGTIRYFDFQTNRQFATRMPAGGTNPASSTFPFVGIMSQLSGMNSKLLHCSKQRGTFDSARLKLVVLAFSPGAPQLPPRDY